MARSPGADHSRRLCSDRALDAGLPGDGASRARAGLLQALGLQIDSRAYNKANGQIRLPNGSVIYAYSAERPERVRGPNLSGAWCDELGHWRYPQRGAKRSCLR